MAAAPERTVSSIDALDGTRLNEVGRPRWLTAARAYAGVDPAGWPPRWHSRRRRYLRGRVDDVSGTRPKASTG